jgi:hypothetical protein
VISGKEAGALACGHVAPGERRCGYSSTHCDVDLLVIMPLRSSKRDLQVAIRAALREFNVPKDVVVTSPEDFAWRSGVPGTIERPAAQQGIVVYAKD